MGLGGGLVGWNCGSIAMSYSVGPVRGYVVGGLVAKNTKVYDAGLPPESGTVVTSFWDVESSGQADSAGGTGLTTAKMRTGSTFLQAGWDFLDETGNGTEDIWWILEGRDSPRLWWELPRDYMVLVVDDFESYTNEIGERVFETWIDGVGFTMWPGHTGNGTGAAVGHDLWDSPSDTIMETQIVHSGRQSMPLYYRNMDPPYYSETDRSWESLQDWTIDDADTLTVYFHGEPDNDPEPLYVAIEDSAGDEMTVTHPDANALTATEWQLWHICLADLQTVGVNPTAIRKLTIGIGNLENLQPAGTGLVYIDDICITKRTP
jgi:hypothetical protein